MVVDVSELQLGGESGEESRGDEGWDSEAETEGRNGKFRWELGQEGMCARDQKKGQISEGGIGNHS